MILVTGGTGLVGGHLLLLLAEGSKPVRALYRNTVTINKTKNVFSHYNKAQLFETIEWIQGDITDIPSLEQAFKGVEEVYHCAAYVSFDPGDEEILRKVNIEGTANMVNCALAFGVKKFCHVSSVAALGDAKEGETIITEETEWNPEKDHADYAISKYGAETEVWRGWQEGLEVIIVNPGLIFGYGFWSQGSGEIFKAVYNGQPFYSTGKCGAVAVEDLVSIMVKLMQMRITGEQYIIVSENISYKAIFDAIADGMNKKRPAIKATPFMTSFAWRLDWFFSKLLFRKRKFTRAMALASHKQTVFDNSKITSALGYPFMDMKNYLKDTASQFETTRRM